MLEIIESLVEKDTKNNTEEYLNSLIAKNDYDALQLFIASRVENQEYLDSILYRDSLREDLVKINDEYNDSKERSAKDVTALLEVRNASLEHREIFEEFSYVQAKINEYRKLTAIAVEALSLIKSNNTKLIKKYRGDRIGDLISKGYFEANSKEWLEQRSGGVGGSDVGPILRVGPKEFKSVNISRVKESKLEAVSTNNESHDYTTAIGRGNAWEEYILQKFAEKNPDISIGYTKDSWENISHPYRKCNFDGLMLNDKGEVVGIVEIKTSSNSLDWGPLEGGLDSIPEAYRKQVLWYATNAKVRKGCVAVLIDDHDYREYFFTIDKSFNEEIYEILDKTDKFWSQIEAIKTKKFISKRKKRTFGFIRELDKVLETAVSYSGYSEAEVKFIADEILKQSETSFDDFSDEEINSFITELFSKFDPEENTTNYYGIDLETTAASPRRGRIIETGIVELKSDSLEAIVYRELHGLPDKVIESQGVGFQEVHHLTEDILEGKAFFEDDKVQEAVLDYLKKGVMVAHNAGFEHRFLLVNLKGYAEAWINGEIRILDTRVLSGYLMPESEDNSLESFTENNGVPYEGAHSAAVDAFMMMKALNKFRKNIFKNKGRFQPQEVSEKDRAEAVKNLSV